MENQFNCCIGKQKFITPDTYKWYVPNGKEAKEITICEWCYENGCFNKEDLYQMEMPSNGKIYINCDCKKEHPTLSEKIMNVLNKNGTILCPSCYFKNKMNAGLRFCQSTIASCKYCRGYIHSSSYTICYRCCVMKNICFECNKEIKSGDEYFSDFWDNFKADENSCMIDDSDGIHLFVL